jgi:hypothetical protein
MMSQDKTYNGWANYATWRVNLEMIDGMDFTGYSNTPHQLAVELKDYAREILLIDQEENLVWDYAMAFLDEVNWYQIAQNIIQEEENE